MPTLKLVIIGNSAAGVAAARSARRVSPTAQITVIGDEGGAAYCRCRIPDVLAGVTDFDGIIMQSGEDFRREGSGLLEGWAARLLPEQRIVALEDGREVSYDRVLVATGAAPVLPDLPGSDLSGVCSFRSYSDARAAGQAAALADDAVVLGGGLVALKAAYALKKLGLPRVTLVVKSRHLMSRQLDDECALMVEEVFKEAGVEIIFQADAAAFLSGPGRSGVGSVALDGGKEIPARLVITGKGVTPRTGLVAGAGGAVGRGVVVDQFLRTSLPGVYAAGDCIEIMDAVTGRRVPSGLWPLAVEQGRFAGMNMAGRPAAYPPALAAQNSVRFGRLSVIAVGRRDEGEKISIRRQGSLKQFFVNDGRLLGYCLVNDVAGAGVYTALVRSGRRVPGLEGLLGAERLPLTAAAGKYPAGSR